MKANGWLIRWLGTVLFVASIFAMTLSSQAAFSCQLVKHANPKATYAAVVRTPSSGAPQNHQDRNPPYFAENEESNSEFTADLIFILANSVFGFRIESILPHQTLRRAVELSLLAPLAIERFHRIHTSLSPPYHRVS